jgi:hypothetical protein
VTFTNRLVEPDGEDLSNPDSDDYRNEINWTPNEGPQTDALNCQADELFYGGAAGGGKTDLAIGLALTQHRNSIIFRRVYKNLRGIINRTVEIIGHRDGLNLSSYTWNRLPGGRTIEFGAMQQEEDKENYKGNPHDLYVFDEAPDFTESQVTFVTAWKRTTIQGQRTRVLLTGNPPTTTQGEWIVRRYAAWLDSKHLNPALPGELRWYAMVDGKEIETLDGRLLTSEPFTHNGEVIKPMSRTFIPARLNDNPFLRETSYGAVLQSLPEPLRSQLLYGDFTLGTQDDEWQAIPTAWVLAAQERWVKMERPALALRAVGVDVAHGGKDKTSIALLWGTWFDDIISYPGVETPKGQDVADRVVKAMGSENAKVGVDAVGYGASAHERLEDFPNLKVVAINAGTASSATDKSGMYGFANLRAEMVWKFREALDPESGEGIALPPSRQLCADLCAPRYSIVGGKYKIEDKLAIKGRINRSPDEGEAVLHCWHVATKRDTKTMHGVARNPFYGTGGR